MKINRYIHSVDNCGIGIEIPAGTYKMTCEPSGYMNTDKKPEKYCGKKFRVKITQKVEVIGVRR